MSKSVKRIVVLCLIMTLIGIMMTGCKGKETEETKETKETKETNEQSTDTSASKTPQNGETDSSNPLEFSVFAGIWSPFPETSDILDAWQENTNSVIDFTWVQRESIETQLAALVSSNQIPDVIIFPIESASYAQKLVNEGVIVSLSDYLEKICLILSAF